MPATPRTPTRLGASTSRAGRRTGLLLGPLLDLRHLVLLPWFMLLSLLLHLWVLGLLPQLMLLSDGRGSPRMRAACRTVSSRPPGSGELPRSLTAFRWREARGKRTEP